VVEPLYYTADLFRRLKPLLTKLRLETGWNYHLRIPPDIATFLKIMQTGEGSLYLQEAGLGHRYPQPQNELLGPLTLIPPPVNVGVIITVNAGNIKKPQDLAGKKVGVPSLLAEGGYITQSRWLQRRGVSPDTLHFVTLGTCEKVLMSVYRGDVAAGFVTLDTLRRLQKDLQPGRIMIMGKSRPLGDWKISARRNVPDFVKAKIRKILSAGKP